MTFSRVDEELRLVPRGSQGLLDEKIDSVLQQLDANPRMVRSGNCETDRIDLTEQLSIVGERPRPVSLCDLGCAIRQDVDNAHQFCARHLRVETRMMLA